MSEVNFFIGLIVILFLWNKVFRTFVLYLIVFLSVIIFYATQVKAQETQIQGRVHGSGESEEVDIHIPQYMPYYPTAASIWPRTIDVNCKEDGDNLECEGYNWKPEMGRTEYLFIRPSIKKDIPKEEILQKPDVVIPIIQNYSSTKPKKKKLYKHTKECK